MMTVGMLKEELDGYSDDLLVRICVPNDDYSDEDNYDSMDVNDFMGFVTITVERD